MERNGHGTTMGSERGYKKAGEELIPHTRSGFSIFLLFTLIPSYLMLSCVFRVKEWGAAYF